jgi:hypothetical protein
MTLRLTSTFNCNTNVLRLTCACNGELDDWLIRYQPLALVPVDAGC